MKSIFEYMGTMIVMIFISFLFVSFLSIETQEIAARNYHTRIVEKIQYDANYAKTVNEDYGENISITLNDDNTIRVVYSYKIYAPIFGELSAKEIIGYAR